MISNFFLFLCKSIIESHGDYFHLFRPLILNKLFGTKLNPQKIRVYFSRNVD